MTRNISRILSGGVFAALIAACGLQNPTQSEAPTPSGVAAPPGTISWTHTDGFAVELVGRGMGTAATDDPENTNPQTVSISDPGSVVRIVAQVTVKGGTENNPPFGSPQKVTITLACGAGATLVELLAPTYTTPFGFIYEHEFNPVTCSDALAVRAEVTGATDSTGTLYGPRSLVAAVFRTPSATRPANSGAKPHADLWWGRAPTEPAGDVYEVTLPIPTANGPRTVRVEYAISELDKASNRTAIVEAAAGGVVENQIHFTPNQGAELVLASLTLSGVPGDVTHVTVRFISPHGDPNALSTTGGDSIFVNDVVVTSLPASLSQGCTPGFWKTHAWFGPAAPDTWPPTGLTPEDTLGSVFTFPESLRNSANDTLIRALGYGGGPGVEGGARILLRAAVAALLNAAHPEVSYPHSLSTVMHDTSTALASLNRDTMLTVAEGFNTANNAHNTSLCTD